MQRERLIEIELPHSGVDVPHSGLNVPHFDEDWTILSARPVVPLADIKGGRSRNILKISAAFAGAGLLGVLVALASIRLRDSSNAQNEQAILPTQNQSVEGTNQSLEPEANQDGIVEAAPVTEASPLPTKTETRVIESEKRQITQNVLPQPDTEIETADPSDQAGAAPDQSGARIVDEWQERRPRRIRTRRPRREFDDLHHRDLLRIEEIFEGRPPRN